MLCGCIYVVEQHGFKESDTVRYCATRWLKCFAVISCYCCNIFLTTPIVTPQQTAISFRDLPRSLSSITSGRIRCLYGMPRNVSRWHSFKILTCNPPNLLTSLSIALLRKRSCASSLRCTPVLTILTPTLARLQIVHVQYHYHSRCDNRILDTRYSA